MGTQTHRMYSHHQQEILSKKGSGRRSWGRKHSATIATIATIATKTIKKAGQIPPNHTQKSPKITVNFFIQTSQPSQPSHAIATIATIARHISSHISHGETPAIAKNRPQAELEAPKQMEN